MSLPGRKNNRASCIAIIGCKPQSAFTKPWRESSELLLLADTHHLTLNP